MALDVKQAVVAAEEYARKLYPKIVYTRLEEVELVKERGFELWEVTLSLQVEDDPLEVTIPPAARMAQMISGVQQSGKGPPTHYKVFKIETNTGRVRSMKIRNLQGS